MKNAKFLSIFFAVIAVVMIAATAVGYVCFHRQPPMLQTPIEDAEARTEMLMEAICSGDYAAAGESLYGKPELQWDQETAAWLSTRLWQAYGESMSYAFSGSCYATGSGIYRDVTITALDVPALSPKIQERFDLLLEPYLTVSRYDSEIYDENGVLLQDFTADILHQAVEQILLEENASVDYQITLELTFQDGQWWVVPEQPLIDIIAGVMQQ